MNTLLPQVLRNLKGHTAEQSGLALASGGVATMVCMPVVGILSGNVDARKLIAFGFVLSAIGLFYMSGLNLR